MDEGLIGAVGALHLGHAPLFAPHNTTIQGYVDRFIALFIRIDDFRDKDSALLGVALQAV
jgi:hypothetical protein